MRGGADILSTETRGGKDYNSIIALLHERYDHPRETCRLTLQRWNSYQVDSTTEWYGKFMTNMAILTATLMQHTDGAIPMVVAVMAEMKLSPKAFQEWMRHTDTDNVPVKAERLKEFMERYRRGLVVTGIDTSSSVKTSQATESRTALRARNRTKHRSSILVDARCVDMTITFSRILVAQRQQTQQWLQMCVSCLCPGHQARNCRSKRSCRTYVKRHHSLLHRDVQVPSNNALPRQQDTSNNSVSSGPPSYRTEASIPPMNQGPSNHVMAESSCMTSDVSLTSILGTW